MSNHPQHRFNPETGQSECECCCGWALDYERLQKIHAEAMRKAAQIIEGSVGWRTKSARDKAARWLDAHREYGNG